MVGILESLLTMALWGSVAAIAVLAVRPFVKKNSHRIMSLLWLVVLFRFLCPVAIESKIPAAWSDKMPDVLNKVAQIEQRKEPQQTLAVQDREYVEKQRNDIQEQRRGYVPNTDAKVLDVNNTSQTNMVSTSGKEMSDGAWNGNDNNIMTAINVVETDDSVVLATIKENLPTILASIWLLGAVIFLTLGTRRYYLISKSLKVAVFLQKWEKYPVKTSDIAGVPMSFGILHPEIYVPKSFEKTGSTIKDAFLTDRQKDMILWHEAMHLKRHDPLMKLAVYAMFAIHWWNPIAWICVKCINQDIEMACDEMVLAHIGRQNRGEYAETLLNFAARSNGISLMASFGESHAESRIKNALRYRKAPIGVTIVTLLFALGFGGCLTLKPVTEEESTELSEENALIEEENLTEENSLTEESSLNEEIPQSEEIDQKEVVTQISDSKTEAEWERVVNNDIYTDKTVYPAPNGSYAEVYRKIIDTYQEKDTTKGQQCDLVYFNNDDVMDLVIYSGETLNLYVYENENVYNVIKDFELSSVVHRGGKKYYNRRYAYYYERKGLITIESNWYNEAISGNILLAWNSDNDVNVLISQGEGADLKESDRNYEAVKKELEECTGWWYNDEMISKQEYEHKLEEYIGGLVPPTFHEQLATGAFTYRGMKALLLNEAMETFTEDYTTTLHFNGEAVELTLTETEAFDGTDYPSFIVRKSGDEIWSGPVPPKTDIYPFVGVYEVDFFDVNLDGLDEFVLIGLTPDGKELLILEYDDDNGSTSDYNFYELSEFLTDLLDENLSIQNIKEAVFGKGYDELNKQM